MAFRWAQRASSCLMALLSFAGVTLFALLQQSLIFLRVAKYYIYIYMIWFKAVAVSTRKGGSMAGVLISRLKAQ
jgi:hypothetical protein